MKSMKLDKQDQVDTAPIMMEGPKYPYGLRITLGTDELKKLGIDKLPGLGDSIKIEAECDVVSVSESESLYGEHRCVELQITAMEVE